MERAIRVVSVSAATIRATSRCSRSAAPAACTPARLPRRSTSPPSIVPRYAGVLSALGMLRRRRDARTIPPTVLRPATRRHDRRARRAVRAARRRGEARLARAKGSRRRACDDRARGSTSATSGSRTRSTVPFTARLSAPSSIARHEQTLRLRRTRRGRSKSSTLRVIAIGRDARSRRCRVDGSRGAGRPPAVRAARPIRRRARADGVLSLGRSRAGRAGAGPAVITGGEATAVDAARLQRSGSIGFGNVVGSRTSPGAEPGGEAVTAVDARSSIPIEFEVFKNLFVSIAEEMGVTLCRTGFSPNIKERLDYSCAVYDAAGETIAQGDHMPVHLGAMPLSVRAAIDARPMEPGDIVMLNDPFRGGTHLPDITLVSPVFLGDASAGPAFYVANRAHHSDVGGMTPGSMPLAREIYQEGLIIPPVRLVRRGAIDPRRAGADPRQRAHARRARGRSDGADRRQSRRRARGCARSSRATAAPHRSATRARAAGLHRARAARDDRGDSGRRVPLRGRLDDDGFTRIADRDPRRGSRSRGDRAIVDFTGTRSAGRAAASTPTSRSRCRPCLYAFRCLVRDDVLYNAGIAASAAR